MPQPLMWSIIFAAAYLIIGAGVSLRMFDYPVGSAWHGVVMLFWPLMLFMR